MAKSAKGKLAMGALFGAVAGVAAGILTAPKSGKETRADLKKKANETKEIASRQTKEARAKASTAANEARGRAEDFAGIADRAIKGAQKGAKEGFNDKSK